MTLRLLVPVIGLLALAGCATFGAAGLLPEARSPFDLVVTREGGTCYATTAYVRPDSVYHQLIARVNASFSVENQTGGPIQVSIFPLSNPNVGAMSGPDARFLDQDGPMIFRTGPIVSNHLISIKCLAATTPDAVAVWVDAAPVLVSQEPTGPKEWLLGRPFELSLRTAVPPSNTGTIGNGTGGMRPKPRDDGKVGQ